MISQTWYYDIKFFIIMKMGEYMKILLGSENLNKKIALEKALIKLNISDYEIITFKVDSGVNSKPIGYEIIRGANNRNQELKKKAIDNHINYDYLCSIEGGFSLDENGLPFVVTYCIIEDKLGKKSTGKSLGIRLSKIMFDFIKNGGSLNEAIGKIIDESNNKQKQGITGYLSDGLYNRADVDRDAVVSSFIPFLYRSQREKLEQYINIKNQN